MFGSNIVDVAIGVGFIYLLLSLLCTAINEALSSLLEKRGMNLFEGIKNLLNDPQFTGLAQQLYNHGLIDGISQSSSNPNKPTRKPSYIPAANFSLALLDILGARGVVAAAHGDLLVAAEQADDAFEMARRKLAERPNDDVLKKALDAAETERDQAEAKLREAAQAQVPGSTMAAVRMLEARRAAIALADNPKDAEQIAHASNTLEQALASARNLAAACPDPLANLQLAVEALPSGHSKESLLVLIDKTKREVRHLEDIGAHVLAFQANVESWFNDSMARVGGWYKRWTQKVLYVIAAIVVVLANADTVKLVQRLSSDGALRAGLVTAAENAVKNRPADEAKDPSEAAQRVSNLLSQKAADVGLPLGWKRAPWAVVSELGYTQPLLWLVLAKLFGLIASVFAVALGAPFWFDTLSRIVNLRGAGTPPGDTKKGAAPTTK